MSDRAGTCAAVFVALYVGHQVGDLWVQTTHQALMKSVRGWAGRWANARHVATVTASKGVTLAAVWAVAGLDVAPAAVAVALVLDAAAHYWIDRRFTLMWLADRTGRGWLARMGSPRSGHDDNPVYGTGAMALDQAFHLAWLFVAAVVMAGWPAASTS